MIGILQDYRMLLPILSFAPIESLRCPQCKIKAQKREEHERSEVPVSIQRDPAECK